MTPDEWLLDQYDYLRRQHRPRGMIGRPILDLLDQPSEGVSHLYHWYAGDVDPHEVIT